MKLAAGSGPEQKSSNCQHQSKIKDLRQATVCSFCVCLALWPQFGRDFPMQGVVALVLGMTFDL